MIPAFRGEFGLKVRFHVPVIYKLNADRLRAGLSAFDVQIERGDEALYPNAAAWHVIPRDQVDAQRHGSPKTRGQPEERFTPVPHGPSQLGPVGYPDIIICPRWRAYVEAKNWPYWNLLLNALRTRYVMAAGTADASMPHLDLHQSSRLWNFERNNDATIEAMRRCKLVIAACSGLAHLAVLCGAPLLLFTHGDRVSPGPVYDSSGRFVSKDGKKLEFEHYYESANHLGSRIERINAWAHPEKLAARALELTA